MSRFILVVGLLTAVAAFSGCVAVVGNTTDTDGESHFWDAKKPKVNATMAEIDAVGKLSSESAKVEGYKTIASRSCLRGCERIYLIKTLDKSSLSESAKQDVLLTLVSNEPKPCCFEHRKCCGKGEKAECKKEK
jgi:hypothetical protein